jgi:hypothetical protein
MGGRILVTLSILSSFVPLESGIITQDSRHSNLFLLDITINFAGFMVQIDVTEATPI